MPDPAPMNPDEAGSAEAGTTEFGAGNQSAVVPHAATNTRTGFLIRKNLVQPRIIRVQLGQ